MQCLFSLYSKTRYEAFEVIVIENNSTDPATKAYYEKLPDRYANCRVVGYSGGFNFSRINNFGRKFANGKFLLLLNNDIEIISGNWLTQMVAEASQPGVAACGAMLYYRTIPSSTRALSPVWVGMRATATSTTSAAVAGTCSAWPPCRIIPPALRPACWCAHRLMMPLAGWMKPLLLHSTMWISACACGKKAGVLCGPPYAELYHHESKSRGSDEEDPAKKARFAKEQARLYEVHGKQNILHDPYYNPNLSLDYEDFRESGDLRNLKNVTL